MLKDFFGLTNKVKEQESLLLPADASDELQTFEPGCCPSCGRKVRDGATLCRSCGSRISADGTFNRPELGTNSATRISNDDLVPVQPERPAILRITLSGEQRSELKKQQNMVAAAVAGLAAAMLGAGLWAALTAATNFQVGYMALGVGLLVGEAVRTFGTGVDKSFGFLGAGLSLLGCVAGNILTVCIVIAGKSDVSPLLVISHLNLSIALDILFQTSSLLDVAFYCLAAAAGYWLSFRRFSQAELAKLAQAN